MKKIIQILFVSLFLMLGSQQIMAQTGTPPPPPGGTGGSGNTSGGGAPIGSGLFILIGMVGIYGGVKGYLYMKRGKILQNKL